MALTLSLSGCGAPPEEAPETEARTDEQWVTRWWWWHHRDAGAPDLAQAPRDLAMAPKPDLAARPADMSVAPAPADLAMAPKPDLAMAPSPDMATPITGRAWYVSPSGSDANAGTVNAPLKSFSGVIAKMKAGDVAFFRAGTYTGPFALRMAGTAQAQFTFRAYPGETPLVTSGGGDGFTVSGSYIVIDGFKIQNKSSGHGIFVDFPAHHVTIQNCDISNSPNQGILLCGNYCTVYRNALHDNGTHSAHDHGIYIESANNVIRSNTVYNNFGYGIQLYNGYNLSQNNTQGRNLIEYNLVYHNGFGTLAASPNDANGGMVIAWSAASDTVRYNVVCDNAKYGIYLIDGVTGNSITNNVSCYNRQGGFYMSSPGSGTTVNGNVSYNDRSFGLSSRGGVTSDNNTYFVAGGTPTLQWGSTNYTLAGFQNASGNDRNSRIADPKFTNVPSGSFDWTVAKTYNFCNQYIGQLCQPMP